MGKLLAFLLALLAIYLIRRALTKPPAPPPGSRPAGSGDTRADPRAERMVECAHCGLHVPESEAVTADGLAFCCAAHRQAHRGGS